MKHLSKYNNKLIPRVKKGFTLLEMLAVIIILAIILLIAIPIVGNVIEESRVGAFKVSASNIGRSAEYTYMNNMMSEGQGERLEFYYNEKIETSNKAGYKLNYKGDNPDYGVVYVNKKGETSVTLYNNRYKLCATKEYNEEVVKVTRNVSKENCEENISRLQLELINKEVFNLEIELGSSYILSENDYVAYNLEGERSTNVEIYVDGVVGNIIDRNILNKEYKIIYKLIDDKEIEITLEKEQTIKIVDTTPPVIEVPENTVLKTSEVLNYNLREGVTVTDNSGEELEYNVISNLSKTPGSHQIKYTAEDSSGNKAEVIRIIDVVDDEAPVITINGSNPMSINVGNTYTELGATAIDEVDGDLTSSIEISGTVNINTVGTYFITYKVKDSEGNEGVATREVRVIDNVPPVIANMSTSATNIAESSFIIIRSGNASDLHSGLAENPYIYQISINGISWITRCTNNSTSCNVMGLNSNTIYYYRICAVDKVGNEACTSTKTVRTSEAINLTITDSRDGKKYKTVKIGSQRWFAEDLMYTGSGCLDTTWHYPEPSCRYNSGEFPNSIEAKTKPDLVRPTVHYQWSAAMNGSVEEGARGLCPSGWHIPTDAEWKILEGTVDSTYGKGHSEWNKTGHRGDDVGTILRSISEGGTNAYGFNGILNSFRSGESGILFDDDLGDMAYYWSSSIIAGENAWVRRLWGDITQVSRYNNHQSLGYSVRCVED